MAEQHIHAWEDWRNQLWYTSDGRLQAEFRTCSGCAVVEARSIERDSRPAVLQPTIGVFGGIFDAAGSVLAKQIETGRYAGDWDAPGGGVDAARASKIPNERMLFSELVRHVEEEVGIPLKPTVDWPILAPAILDGGGDWAFPIVVGTVTVNPTKGTTRFLSLDDLENLVQEPKGAQILSGRGKRMHRIFLRFLTRSPNIVYAQEAMTILVHLQHELGLI